MTFDIAIGVLFALLLISLARAGGKLGRDSTDDPNGARSGFVILTDHATGVQYLAIPFVGLSPRIDSNGKPYFYAGKAQR